MYYFQEKDIVFRKCRWVIHAQCNGTGVEEDIVTVFLVITLINKTKQFDGVKVMDPEWGSEQDKEWNPDEEETEE